MHTTMQIDDDFNLEKIAKSGECFRVRIFDDNTYRFITGCNVIYIKRLAGDDISGTYDISCSIEEWHNVWVPYFDLNRSYRDICKDCQGISQFIDASMEFGCGVRVLRQNPWEMLVTFIISQRKNIPAISKSVNLIAEKFGRPITTEYETLYAFPTPEELAIATEQDLRDCSLGYRAPYVMDAIRLVNSGELDLQEISSLSDEALFERLQCVCGVGKKVANCICLFAYGRTSLVPVDVWIARAIEEDCEGSDPFAAYGQMAGIMQQYAFYYMTNRE